MFIVMKLKKLVVRLKSGKSVLYHYKRGDGDFVTFEVTYKNDTFNLYSYVFEGEEVDHNGKLVQYINDEFTANFSDFNALIAYLESKFPGINLDEK